LSSLDTNVLVRYLVNDDANQHAQAARFIESQDNETALFIPITVSLELEWVLRTRYGVNKEGIISVYTQLLETAGLELQDEASVERALSLYTEYSADFADCLHLALSISNQQLPLVTFDKKASKIPSVITPS